ncbi:RagB/SusD family nutrient uptake outer membrane protein [Hymenobacter sp. PAMC 26628]|uniref:RagB/SusD family nutrient uptake outer membrane protein n=1 Tax=Hymenobacter sp. PAMC 26628 TaxID=1484118 RepID=UPI00076FFF8D|nr:RagB/SusD family nutrient uptake outer membrane protein [Hymenobacter sp. PAMC 26628]AMJ66719.1 hypothetical protein AXW84_15745 [Hymenobacter sp. PAMC 26628]
MKSILKKTTVAACTVLLGLGTFSCNNDLLNPTSQITLSDQVVFSNPARIGLQVQGLYSYVKAGNLLGGRAQVYGDIRANDFLNRTNNAVTGLTVWNHTETETSTNDVVNMWGAAYAAINQINVFLGGLDANAASFVAPTFPSTFATTSLSYQGEARLLRALCYYTLLQFYARPYTDGGGTRPGLPLRLLSDTGLGSNDLARSTVGEVYTQILADLTFAEQNLPLTYSTSFDNVTRAHRNTAIALKTRVYLTMGLYTDVIREAEKIIPATATTAPFTASSGVPNALNSSIAAVFTGSQETTESILSFPFTAANTPGGQNSLASYYLPSQLLATAPIYNGNGAEYVLNTAAGSIYANTGWAATDARRTNFVAQVGTNYFLTKYLTGPVFIDKAPVIRYSEVLLNLAEARVRSTNTINAQALALLNAVRSRSNATPYTAAGLGTVAATTDALLLERRIEFLGEGLRNTDLLRLGATIPAKGSAPAIVPTDVRYVWPIPSTELATNTLMTRN